MNIFPTLESEITRIKTDIQLKGYSIKQFNTIENGVAQQYKVCIFTAKRTINNVFVT